MINMVKKLVKKAKNSDHSLTKPAEQVVSESLHRISESQNKQCDRKREDAVAEGF
jgi:vacuolar-type H+-ATPase subunit H